MVQAISNPFIHIISHPGDGTAALHFEPVSYTHLSCHLGHQLESTLIAPEVREVQNRISIQNPHHTDMIKVQSFGYHLSTNQNVR